MQVFCGFFQIKTLLVRIFCLLRFVFFLAHIIQLISRSSLGHLGFKAFYVSPKLARRTYSLTVHRTLRGAAIPLHAHRLVGIISQWPPLSGPTRRRMPTDCNFAIVFATARREISNLSAIS